MCLFAVLFLTVAMNLHAKLVQRCLKHCLKSLRKNSESVERKCVCVVFLYIQVSHGLALRCLFILMVTPGANRLFLLVALVY